MTNKEIETSLVRCKNAERVEVPASMWVDVLEKLRVFNYINENFDIEIIDSWVDDAKIFTIQNYHGRAYCEISKKLAKLVRKVCK